MRALSKQVEVELADGRHVTVRIGVLPGAAVREAKADAIPDRQLPIGQMETEDAVGERFGRQNLVAEQDLATLSVGMERPEDRKSTRLNSSHSQISYAVFCLKK